MQEERNSENRKDSRRERERVGRGGRWRERVRERGSNSYHNINFVRIYMYLRDLFKDLFHLIHL